MYHTESESNHETLWCACCSHAQPRRGLRMTVAAHNGKKKEKRTKQNRVFLGVRPTQQGMPLTESNDCEQPGRGDLSK